MIIKTSELAGPALDWAVAKAQGCTQSRLEPETFLYIRMQGACRFTSEWAEMGPIIEREGISIVLGMTIYDWWAYTEEETDKINGDTPLIAAARCYVSSKLGNEVDIPDNLVNKA